MYTILLDGEILYDVRLSQSGYIVINPKLTKEQGQIDQLEFSLYETNPMYNKIKRMKSIIQVFENEEEVFRGRCVNVETDMRKKKKVSCTGCLSFLYDSVIRPYKYTEYISVKDFLSNILLSHNIDMGDDNTKKIQLGNVFVQDGYSEGIELKEYQTAYDVVRENVLDKFGGYFKTRFLENNIYLDYYPEQIEFCTQPIEFGKNMLDLTEFIDCENVFTTIIPLGAEVKDAEGNVNGRLTIKSVNGGFDYLDNPEGIQVFGRISKIVIYEDVEDANELLARGSVALYNAIKENISVTLKLVDLHVLDVNVDRIDEGEQVEIISKPHGLDDYFPCTQVVIYMAEPDKSSYTFGEKKKKLTSEIKKRK